MIIKNKFKATLLNSYCDEDQTAVSCGLIICNTGDEPTFISAVRGEVLDVSL